MMSETLQLWIVLPIVAVSGFFAVRVFLRQFTRPDDEPAGCAGCKHNPDADPSERFPRVIKH